MAQSQFRWRNPYEWLAEKAQGWTEEELRDRLIKLAAGLENDAIQELHENEMAEDGYFDVATPSPSSACPKCTIVGARLVLGINAQYLYCTVCDYHYHFGGIGKG